MKILLLRTWTINIGNGFIDKGARTIIEKAFPDAEIIETSGYPHLVEERRNRGLITSPFDIGSKSNLCNIAELIDADLAVLPGCVLYGHVLDKFEPVFRSLKERDIPLVLLGVGGGNYEVDTQKRVRDFLNNFNLDGMITRDKNAFEIYSSHIDNSYSGIDCAFFIDDWYDPPSSNQEINVHTFDKIDEPPIEDSGRTIRANHYPFGQPHGLLRQRFDQYKSYRQFFKQDDTFVSDMLEDYLFLYANSKKTHSDRIHACVPSLAYGNEARFWFDTPRASLFDHVIEEDITRKTVSLDAAKISALKNEQIRLFRDIVESSL